MKTVELNVIPDNLGNNWNNWSENGTLTRVTDFQPNRPITRKMRMQWTVEAEADLKAWGFIK